LHVDFAISASSSGSLHASRKLKHRDTVDLYPLPVVKEVASTLKGSTDPRTRNASILAHVSNDSESHDTFTFTCISSRLHWQTQLLCCRPIK
jgi:hypothetical protein